jgi:hypothetical protein
MMTREEFTAHLSAQPGPGSLDDVLGFVQGLGRSESLPDDFSLIELDFQ